MSINLEFVTDGAAQAVISLAEDISFIDVGVNFTIPHNHKLALVVHCNSRVLLCPGKGRVNDELLTGCNGVKCVAPGMDIIIAGPLRVAVPGHHETSAPIYGNRWTGEGAKTDCACLERIRLGCTICIIKSCHY